MTNSSQTSSSALAEDYKMSFSQFWNWCTSHVLERLDWDASTIQAGGKTQCETASSAHCAGSHASEG